jgi:16S rRNA (guanine1207-N2)-methyltransferase
MNNACMTLFHPCESGALRALPKPFSAAFLNAQLAPALKDIGAETTFVQQYFKSYANALQDAGHHVSSDIPQNHPLFDVVFILLPKNAAEARYILARGVSMLKTGGMIFCAADNKAGGTRIQKMLQDFGMDDVQQSSKNKARVCWARCGALNQPAVDAALSAGAAQEVIGGEYRSMPGVFGWDKIDKGSKILLQNIKDELRGKGADFGCGYGYLARNILQKYPEITDLFCIDADFRAVTLCRENLQSISHVATIRYFWEDLTAWFPEHRDLDFIIMNPPFHEGKTADSDIGRAFIKTAYKSLSPGGSLWMVANAQLPYEDVLLEKFTSVEKKFEGQGFKVFMAVK